MEQAQLQSLTVEQAMAEAVRLKSIWFDIEMEQRRLSGLRTQVEETLQQLTTKINEANEAQQASPKPEVKELEPQPAKSKK